MTVLFLRLMAINVKAVTETHRKQWGTRHILEYKYLHKENHYLEGESLEKYISLIESGALWSLIEENKFWESDSTIRRIFEYTLVTPLTGDSKSDSDRIMYLEIPSLKD